MGCPRSLSPPTLPSPPTLVIRTVWHQGVPRTCQPAAVGRKSNGGQRPCRSWSCSHNQPSRTRLRSRRSARSNWHRTPRLDDVGAQGMQPPQRQMPDQQQPVQMRRIGDVALLQPPAAPLAVAEGGFHAAAPGVLAHTRPAAGAGAEQDPPLAPSRATVDGQIPGAPARALEDLHGSAPAVADGPDPVPQAPLRPAVAPPHRGPGAADGLGWRPTLSRMHHVPAQLLGGIDESGTSHPAVAQQRHLAAGRQRGGDGGQQGRQQRLQPSPARASCCGTSRQVKGSTRRWTTMPTHSTVQLAAMGRGIEDQHHLLARPAPPAGAAAAAATTSRPSPPGWPGSGASGARCWAPGPPAAARRPPD